MLTGCPSGSKMRMFGLLRETRARDMLMRRSRVWASSTISRMPVPEVMTNRTALNPKRHVRSLESATVTLARAPARAFSCVRAAGVKLTSAAGQNHAYVDGA